MSVVLDASALLAYLQAEPGSDEVEAALDGAAMCTVNWAEVIQKAKAAEVETPTLRADLEALGLELQPFTSNQAEIAAELWQRTRYIGLSLGDRACLALALDTDRPTLTTDRAWQQINIGVTITLIR
jgi:PIN domain nuclease of toxin-antitoxin system